jgi:sugar (pentulose or hexulose) kinase
MKEIQRLAGGEAEFAKSTYIQRQSLAKALGMSVEELARTVRNNTAGATGAAAGAAAAGGQSTQSSDMRAHELLGKIVRNTE